MVISRDDLQDVVELSESLSLSAYELLQDHDFHIAMSALINSSIHSILNQCDNLEEALKYRTTLVEMFDKNLKTFR